MAIFGRANILEESHSSRVGNRVLPAVLALVVGSAATACGGKENGAVVSTVGGSSEHSASGGTAALLASGGASATLATGGSAATGGSSTKASAPSTGGATGGVSSTTSTGGSSATGGAAGSSSAGAQAVQAFTTSYVTPYCTRLADCCTQAGYTASSATSCANTELGYYETSLADGSVQVNSTGVAALLNAIQNKCDQPSDTLYSNLTAGTRPIGSDCTDVSRCQGDSVACLIASTASVGKCVALTRGKIGDPCAVGCDNTTSCRWTINGGNATQTAACWDEEGLRCDSGTNTCVSLVGMGNSCDSLTCGAHADCLNGVCVAKGKLGESCSTGRSCESTLSCNSSYICEKMSIAWSGSCGS